MYQFNIIEKIFLRIMKNKIKIKKNVKLFSEGLMSKNKKILSIILFEDTPVIISNAG